MKYPKTPQGRMVTRPVTVGYRSMRLVNCQSSQEKKPLPQRGKNRLRLIR